MPGANTEDDVSLREELAATFAESGKGDGDLDSTIDKLDPPAKVEKERDETGKFKAKEETESTEKVEPTDPAAEEVKKDPILKEDRAPTGWNPKVREKWGELPEDVRAEVVRREEASAHGVRQLQEQFKPANDFVQSLAPYIQEAISGGQNPAQYIGNVMAAEKRLRFGTDEERFGALADVADSYGIPLRAILKEALGYDVAPKRIQQQQQQIPAEVQRELEESRRFREQHTQTESQRAAAEITAFAKDKPYFEDVSQDMGLLLEQGRATSLEDAYNKACRMNNDVWDLMQAKGHIKTDAEKLAERQKAASRARTSSSNSAETTSTQDEDDDDIATTIRKAISRGDRI
jgi:hypothetical protein